MIEEKEKSFEERFLEYLIQSSRYDKTLVPARNNEEAFLSHLRMSYDAACVCNLNAIKYLAGLMVTDREFALDQNLFYEFSKIMTVLRDKKSVLFKNLSKIANNENDTYPADLMNFAQATLQEFSSRKHLEDLLSNTLDDDFVLVGEEAAETDLDASIRTPFAIAKLANATQNYLDSHIIKPEVLLHMNAVLRAVGNTTQDIYGVIVAEHIAPKIKTTLEVALNSQVPAFKKTKDQYSALIEILAAVITHPENDREKQDKGDRSTTLTRANSFVGNIGALTSSEELTRFTNPFTSDY